MATIEQEFVCALCGHEDAYAYQGEDAPAPKHCHSQMRPGRVRFPDMGDPGELRLHTVILQQKPTVDWVSGAEDYPHVIELWQLRPGRKNGERLGWIGCRESEVIDPLTREKTIVCEFRLPPGVSYRDQFGDRHQGGFAADVEHAAGTMLQALEGGIYTGKYIDAIRPEVA